MPMQRLPRRVLGRSQAIARQDTLVQAPELFNDHCLHVGLLVLWNKLGNGSLNGGEWVELRMRDELTDRLARKPTATISRDRSRPRHRTQGQAPEEPPSPQPSSTNPTKIQFSFRCAIAWPGSSLRINRH